MRHFCTEEPGLQVTQLMPFLRWQRLGIPTLLCFDPFVQAILLISQTLKNNPYESALQSLKGKKEKRPWGCLICTVT